MTENQNSYRQIMKATSIFGGVQAFNILIQLIRSKILAILLGPSGMGIFGLLTNTLNFITSATAFGLGSSAVKDVAEANGTGDQSKTSKIVLVLRKLVWITGFLGFFVTLILSPILSKITFGSFEYTFAFIWISVTLLFNQLTTGQLVVLQGLRKLNYLAKANLAGSIIGLVFTIPLYYFFGVKGIVPVIILTSLISLLCVWYFSQKIPIEKSNITFNNSIKMGKEMLKMGFILSISGLITSGSSYLLRIYLNHVGGIGQVGLYTAGFAIVNTYVGLIFTAMTTDYYPRLSVVANDRAACNKIINQQAEIALLILIPILVFFVVFIKWIIIILYSNQFIDVCGMIYWSALGIVFKAICWSMGFIFLAKGASKLFFINELIVNIYMLGLNIVSYKLFGINGLGISYLVSFFIYTTQIYWVINKKYKFNFDKDLISILKIQFPFLVTAFLIVIFWPTKLILIVGSILFLISGLISIIILDKKLNFGFIKKVIKVFNHGQ
jgi:O-antigen/teichoic acid export membrane protein